MTSALQNNIKADRTVTGPYVPFAPIYHNMLQYYIDLNGKTILVTIKYADTTPLERDFGFKPSTPLREGLRKFAE